MSRNGSGVYSPPAPEYPAVAGTLIQSAYFNTIISDIATALTLSIAANGETTITANIPMAGFKITGLGSGTARTDAAALGQIAEEDGVYAATVGGTADAITLTPSPSIAAYAAGQRFTFIASGANTGAVTVNVSSVGAKNVTKRGNTTLEAGDIQSSQMVTIQYDGTRFQMLAPRDMARKSADETISGSWTFTGIPIFSGTSPRHYFFETDQASGEQAWRHIIIGKEWFWQTGDDDFSNTRNIMRVTRGSNRVVTAIEVGNDTDNPEFKVNAGELDIRATSFDADSVVAGGTYTPVGTNVANVAVVTPAVAMYIRIGAIVTVSGEVAVDPTSLGTLTRFRMTLPIASALSNAHELSGVGTDDQLGSTGIISNYQIFGDASNNAAEFRNEGIGSTSSRLVRYTYMYRVI